MSLDDKIDTHVSKVRRIRRMRNFLAGTLLIIGVLAAVFIVWRLAM